MTIRLTAETQTLKDEDQQSRQEQSLDDTVRAASVAES